MTTTGVARQATTNNSSVDYLNGLSSEDNGDIAKARSIPPGLTCFKDRKY